MNLNTDPLSTGKTEKQEQMTQGNQIDLYLQNEIEELKKSLDKSETPDKETLNDIAIFESVKQARDSYDTLTKTQKYNVENSEGSVSLRNPEYIKKTEGMTPELSVKAGRVNQVIDEFLNAFSGPRLWENDYDVKNSMDYFVVVVLHLVVKYFENPNATYSRNPNKNINVDIKEALDGLANHISSVKLLVESENKKGNNIRFDLNFNHIRNTILESVDVPLSDILKPVTLGGAYRNN